MTEEETIIDTPAPYPKVDWSCVNSRFIKNIPIPNSFPLHGCSQDSNFYKLHLSYSRGNQSQFTTLNHPFGPAYGYQTSEGIVSVPEEVHHGYIWQGHQWILHAKLPTQPRHEEKRRREIVRGKRGKRGKRGRRRGERGKRGKRGCASMKDNRNHLRLIAASSTYYCRCICDLFIPIHSYTDHHPCSITSIHSDYRLVQPLWHSYLAKPESEVPKSKVQSPKVPKSQRSKGLGLTQ